MTSRTICRLPVGASLAGPVLAGALLSGALVGPAVAASGSALVMPFDASAGSVSFLAASHPASAAAPGGVRTHWVFWSDRCELLLDAMFCLPPDGSIVVDPTRIEVATPPAALVGRRGFVTVTAYGVEGSCDAAPDGRSALVADALMGTFTLAAVASGVSFGSEAIALPADASGSFVDLPNVALRDGAAVLAALRLQTFDPAKLDVSRVILLALRERAGSGSFRATELGPAGGGDRNVRATVRFAGKNGTSIRLPETTFGCAAFTSLRRADVPTLSPPGGRDDGIGTGGFFELETPSIDEHPVGDTTWLFGFHGQAVGTFGVLAVSDVTLAARPMPTPGGTPAMSSTASKSSTPRPSGAVALPTATPSASATQTPGPTQDPSPGPTSTSTIRAGTPTPAMSPTATPLSTGTPVLTPLPASTATLGLTPGRRTPGGGTPSATLTSTVTPRTPSPALPSPTETASLNGCATLTLEVRTEYGTSRPTDVSGVIATVRYPSPVSIPGQGSDASVVERVANVSGVSGLFQATDSEAALRIGLVSVSAAIPQGDFVRVLFDCTTGTLPDASEFGCALEASTSEGELVPGAGCTTEILP